MPQRERSDIVWFLLLWSALVLVIVAEASGRVRVPLLDFPQAKGELILLQEGYNKVNLVALRDEVYAIPQGTEFLHPARTALLKEKHIFVAHSIEEARRMVDAGSDQIPHLVFVERLLDRNIYQIGDHFYAVPAMDRDSGSPLPLPNPYSERAVGNSLSEARASVMRIAAGQ
jgi:hypothetical protein